MEEWSRYYVRPQVHGIAFIHAAFVTHAFPWHAHDHYALGVIETGSQTFSCRGGKHATSTGGLFVVHPDEPHTGEPASPTGFTYRTFYPTVELMARAAAELVGRQRSTPYFPAAVIADPVLARRFVALQHTLIAQPGTLEGETRLLGALAALIARHAAPQVTLRPPGRERTAVREARAYIAAHYGDDLSLTDLARLSGLSPFYFARVFRAEVGLPPHAYLESVRIGVAQGLLTQGVPLAAVAQATGFADQSHFTRRFRRTIGVPPGQYARAGQDRTRPRSLDPLV